MLLTELWLAAEELLFGLGAGHKGTKGGVALDKVDAGRLPITYFNIPSKSGKGETGHLPSWTTRRAVGF